MPENSTVTAAAVADIRHKEKVFKPVKRSFLCWFLKHEKKNQSEISINRSRYRLRPAPVGSPMKPQVRNSQVHPEAFNYKTRVEPSQVYQLRPTSPGLCSHFDSAIVPRASDCQETWLSRHGVRGPLMLVAIVLALLLVVSRITVITCVCAWLYLFPRLKAPTQRKNVTEKGIREDVEIDLNSKEYKKMAVLKGLLERDHAHMLMKMPLV
ncbi:uncharacterized protein LOC122021940 [Zingiber officinale]|uniref:uncharacterized protein LOC122021940 n=1 Tax=Zingiber officinale TaxID=94328 RepID=UPI001C4A7849|nr:uncharacterized protein LOC122021940 [Zingiber officinale]